MRASAGSVRRVVRALVIGCLVLAVWELLAIAGARFLVVRSPLARADAIVVLSGSAAHVERAQWAAQLYKNGLAPKIILTNDNQMGGWSEPLQRNPFYYERSRDQLLNAGVPPEAIKVWLEPVSSTYEEAQLIRAVQRVQGLKSMVLVTSPYHSRRAFWTFRRVLGDSNTEIGIEPVSASIPPSTWWLHLKGWQIVPVEYVKLLYYMFRF
jgi:uncharacterized SAM-binding protein YcdF (DUF218 family)